jgi:hypothetical protein
MANPQLSLEVQELMLGRCILQLDTPAAMPLCLQSIRSLSTLGSAGITVTQFLYTRGCEEHIYPNGISSTNPGSLGMSTGDEETFEVVHRWLKHCLNYHLRCAEHDEVSRVIRPARLLSIGEKSE